MSKLLIENWYKRLISCKVPEPQLSIRYFLEDIVFTNLGYSEKSLSEFKNLVIDDSQAKQIEKMIFRREYHEPIQYILGKWPFRNLQLKMKSPVFIPRPETEGIVDLVKKYSLTKNVALEIGVGSGPISLSLLKETDLSVFAIDKSEDAVNLTLENQCLNELSHKNLKISQIELSSNHSQNIDNIIGFLNTKCDILISNPPYIPYQQLLKLEHQILWYESIDALNGGLDGMDIIKRILNIIKDIMNNKGIIILEFDITHPPLFDKLINENPQWNVTILEICNDIFDRPRFVILQFNMPDRFTK